MKENSFQDSGSANGVEQNKVLSTEDESVAYGEHKIAENVTNFVADSSKATLDGAFKKAGKGNSVDAESIADEGDAVCPALEASVIERLPGILRPMVDNFSYGSDYTATMLAVGQLATLSAVMPNVETVVFGKTYYPNLEFIVAAPPASGKGQLQLCKLLVADIDSKLHEEYEEAWFVWAESADRKRRTVKMPPMKAMVFPANCTNAAFVKLLSDNKGRGLIFESELKHLLGMLNNQEYGLQPAMLLNAAEHEAIEKSTASDGKVEKIENPRLSLVASGVFEDVLSLLGRDGVSNGLMSRMLFFNLCEMKRVWRSWASSVEDDEPAESVLSESIEAVKDLYELLNQRQNALQVKMTARQGTMIDRWIGRIFVENAESKMLGADWDSVLKRMPVHVCRIAMILTVLRCLEEDKISLKIADSLSISDYDFTTAIEIGKLLLEHTRFFYLYCCNEKNKAHSGNVVRKMKEVVRRIDASKKQKIMLLLGAMPNFTKEEYKNLALSAGYNGNKGSLNRLWRELLAAHKILPIADGSRFAVAESYAA